MAPKIRWLDVLLVVVFLGLLVGYDWFHDPYLYWDSEALFHRAQEAEKQGDLSFAIELADKAWKRDPDLSDCGTFLGWLYLKQDQLEPAREILGQVWERDPKATGALKGLALVLNRTGERLQALNLLGNYLKGNPQDTDLLFFAAQLASQGDQDKNLTLGYYRQHYRVEPTPEVRRALVDLLIGSQHFQEAVASRKKR